MYVVTCDIGPLDREADGAALRLKSNAEAMERHMDGVVRFPGTGNVETEGRVG